jgi:hypothetical protein
LVADGLLVVVDSGGGVAGLVVDEAELVVGDGEVVDGVGGEHGEGLVVAAGGVVEMAGQLFGAGAGTAGVVEAFEGDTTELSDGFGSADVVVGVEEVEALLEPPLGLVEVS